MNYEITQQLQEIYGIDYDSDECIVHDHIYLDCRSFIYIEYESRHYVFRLYNEKDIDLFSEGERNCIDTMQYAQDEYNDYI